MGVIFFVYNAIFACVLLIIVLVASIIAVVAKNPDTRYQPMRDDRGSFIKSQTQLSTELDALGATARGESKHGWHNGNNKSGARIEDDEEDSWSGGSSSDRAQHHQQQQQQQNTAYGGAGGYASDAGSGRHVPQNYAPSHTNSMTSQNRFRQQQSGSPSPWQRGAGYE